MTDNRVYKVLFRDRDKVYELYARSVGQSDLYGFVEVREIIFGERSGLLVDPSEERLKSEFAGVSRTYIPIQAVIRIDQVDKEGPSKVVTAGDKGGGTVTPLPLPPHTPKTPT
jgi:hypothetical protein